MNLLRYSTLLLCYALSPFAVSCETFSFETERQVFQGYEQAIKQASTSQQPSSYDFLLLSIKYRYGFGTKINLTKSTAYLQNIAQSDETSITALKYYFLATNKLCDGFDTQSLTYLKQSAQLGNHSARFLYHYLTYYRSDTTSLEQYVAALMALAKDYDKYAIFELIYLAQTYQLKRPEIEIYQRTFAESTVFVTCDLYEFARRGSGVNGLVVGWAEKQQLITRYWPDYVKQCQ
ncbi:hypothetical protein F0224_25580 [Vibrio coralliilyticus]|uniref:hypothetical protein n=1 Tax=Vibrio coralliilyticus TaxID=190893 RepID=UPI000BAC1D52|nr:hypothetical protein [Vibrio coralliilyticus]NOI79015.1 hypothetical protein [Vibrio coralliilyticus]PAW00228.1 hypothetical protein CKJ79_27995 [Vibrio coralliilyticus]